MSLGILETLICFWEAYEFAARLALSPAGAPEMQVTVSGVGLAGRLVVVDSPGRAPLAFDYRATLAEYPDELNISTAQLVADPIQLAVQAASSLFERFGRQADPAGLRGALEDFRRSR